MKRLPLAWLLLGATALAGSAPAAAKTCALDVVPAATLLLPYFEVDLRRSAGRTTLMSINNASDRAALTRVVLWTDLGVPTLGFEVYLTGFDVQTLNLRDVFAGVLPRTADADEDRNGDISPRGPLSQDVAFPNCNGALPPPAMPAAFVDHLAKAHQGQPSPILEGKCAAQDFGDGIARGYVTVDVVRRCSQLTPADAGYFGPDGVAANDNVLWGDFYLVDPAGDLAQGENLVRIESDPARFAGKPTFYDRYVSGSGADGREPLPTVWGTRFINGGAFASGTEVVYWRNSEARGQPFVCGQGPSWYPLRWDFTRTTVFDEEEHAEFPSCPFPVTCPLLPSPFPAESGRVRVDSPGFPTPFTFGWWYLDMKLDNGFGAASQAWLGTLHSAQGVFSVGLEAEPFDNGCEPRTTNVGGSN